MSDQQLAFETVASLAARLRARELTAAELTGLFLARAARLNPRCKAFIEIADSRARAAAAALDAVSAPQGPLHGIPFAAKDLIDVAGMRTTAGSRVLADNLAAEDAEVTARLQAAGALCLGKTNLHEFAYGATGENAVHGTAVNAYDSGRLAGGSSSGSAAALAFGLAPAALGTDTGGSVRVPAALNGLVGLKPTYGLISTRGTIPYCWSLDHIGILARSVADAALLLQATAGHDPRDPGSAREPVGDYRAAAAAASDGALAGLRCGVPRGFFFERGDAQILAASEAVLRYLESAGAELVEVALPSMEHARTVSLTIQMPEALSYHARYLEERGDLYGADFRAGLALGQCLLAEHYIRAKRMVTRYRQETEAVFDRVDVLATPATPIVAPEIGTVEVTVDGEREPVGNALTRYASFFNMTGHPAITLPSGLHTSGLPMGVQIVARAFEEETLLRVAAAVERQERFAAPLPNPESILF